MWNKLKLTEYTYKRYEPKLDTYYFFNVKNGNFWKTDKTTGAVIASLDGSLSAEEIVNILVPNSIDVSSDDIKNHFGGIFKFLIKEGFICNAN